MKNSLLNKIFDVIISEKLINDSEIFEKVVNKYKKSNGIDDETEVANDLCELIYYEQKRAFRVGFEVALDLMKEKQ